MPATSVCTRTVFSFWTICFSSSRCCSRLRDSSSFARFNSSPWAASCVSWFWTTALCAATRRRVDTRPTSPLGFHDDDVVEVGVVLPCERCRQEILEPPIRLKQQRLVEQPLSDRTAAVKREAVTPAQQRAHLGARTEADD